MNQHRQVGEQEQIDGDGHQRACLTETAHIKQGDHCQESQRYQNPVSPQVRKGRSDRLHTSGEANSGGQYIVDEQRRRGQ